MQYKSKHVGNHLKTTIKEQGTIAKFTNKSGFGWDDFLKIITILKDVYDKKKYNKCMINIILFVIFTFTFISKTLYKELKNCIF